MNWLGRYFPWMRILTKPKTQPVVIKITEPQKVDRITWVEAHGYYNPAEAELGRALDDAQRWHGWPNCAPMVGIDGNWPVSRYPELAGREPHSYWRWEQIVDFGQLAAYPGGYLFASDGFEAGTGDANKLIENAKTGACRGVILQAGHANRQHANALRAAGLETQAWASCSQISQDDLRASLAELQPTRFVGQIEGPAEREAMAAYVAAGVFAMPWDTVIAGWGDFAAL